MRLFLFVTIIIGHGPVCLLAGEAMPVNEIDRDQAEKRLRDAEEAHAQVDGDNPVEEELALERVHSARAMTEALEGLLTGH